MNVLGSTSVLRGESVTLRATVVQGVNVTFDWNFCHKGRRSSTPHQNNENCLKVVCQSDEQVIFTSSNKMMYNKG